MTFSDHETQPALSTLEESDIEQYRAVSPAAIIALLLGLASFLVLTANNLLLLFLPVVAITVALFALAQIARSEGALVGRKAAIAGICLALLFGSSALARSATREWLLHSQARQFAEGWLQLVRRGKLHHAHQLHLSPFQRQSSHLSLSDHYAESEAERDRFEQFFGEPPLNTIAAAASHASIRFEGVVEHATLKKADQVAMLFVLDRPGEDQPQLRFVVVTERSADRQTGDVFWRLVAVSKPRGDDAP